MHKNAFRSSESKRRGLSFVLALAMVFVSYLPVEAKTGQELAQTSAEQSNLTADQLRQKKLLNKHFKPGEEYHNMINRGEKTYYEQNTTTLDDYDGFADYNFYACAGEACEDDFYGKEIGVLNLNEYNSASVAVYYGDGTSDYGQLKHYEWGEVRTIRINKEKAKETWMEIIFFGPEGSFALVADGKVFFDWMRIEKTVELKAEMEKEDSKYKNDKMTFVFKNDYWWIYEYDPKPETKQPEKKSEEKQPAKNTTNQVVNQTTNQTTNTTTNQPKVNNGVNTNTNTNTNTVANTSANVASEAVTFDDVASNHWAYSDITYVRINGLMQGVGRNRFNPEGVLTREQLIQTIYNLAKRELAIDNNNSVNVIDVKAGDWSKEAIDWAVTSGIVQLENGRIRPKQAATRGFVVELMYKFLAKTGIDITVSESSNGVFADAPNSVALNYLYQNKLISGYPDGKAHLEKSLTRCQLAAFLRRTHQFISKQ